MINSSSHLHQPVLVDQVLHYLSVKPDHWYLDGTIGLGGHAAAIIKAGGLVIGLDCDSQSLALAAKTLPQSKIKLIHGNYSQLSSLISQLSPQKYAGAILDLGVSSYQLKDPQRGLSFQTTGPLDMRLDRTSQLTAKEIINQWEESRLYALFTTMAQEQLARSIAHALVRARQLKPITTTTDLVEQILLVTGPQKSHLHPATKIFQALRIAVNDEINHLKQALPQFVQALSPTSRLCVISFHEGEDRVVKHFFQQQQKLNRVRILTKKPIMPNLTETKSNPSSRSAKLRAIAIL